MGNKRIIKSALKKFRSRGKDTFCSIPSETLLRHGDKLYKVVDAGVE